MTELRRYNLVAKVIGQPLNFEYEAAANGEVVQADQAVTLVEELREQIKELENRHVQFMVQGGPVVMASEYDALRTTNKNMNRRIGALEKALNNHEGKNLWGKWHKAVSACWTEDRAKFKTENERLRELIAEYRSEHDSVAHNCSCRDDEFGDTRCSTCLKADEVLKP